jgi:hypothetical protein
MCQPGDIVQIYSATAGYPKWHLCIAADTETEAAKFLYVNSEGGYDGDFVLPNARIPCIPASPTGKTVISCNILVIINRRQRELFNAQVAGQLDKAAAAELKAHVEGCDTLTRPDKELVVNALDTYCGT